MGHKVNPYGFRLGIVTDWKSRWIASGKEYREFLVEDIKIREYLKKELERAAVSRVEIERNPLLHPAINGTTSWRITHHPKTLHLFAPGRVREAVRKAKALNQHFDCPLQFTSIHGGREDESVTESHRALTAAAPTIPPRRQAFGKEWPG